MMLALPQANQGIFAELWMWANEAHPLELDFGRFVREAWPILEPTTKLIWNWHMDVLCGYLQALYEGRLRVPRLIINIPPGTSKSLVASVFFQAWIWAKAPGLRFAMLSNEESLTTRDNLKMRSLVMSDWYQERWPHVKPDRSQWEKTFFQNTDLGFRQGLTVRGGVTGKRGDIQCIDDPHDARKAFSEAEIKVATDAWDQGLSTRVNNFETSLRMVIMQRLRINDLTGHLLSKKEQPWVHLVIPMRYTGAPTYDPVRDIGPEAAHLADPRKEVGESLDKVRFTEEVLRSLREDLGEYGWAGQMQQEPIPMGGGIIKSKWWERWPKSKPLPNVAHVFCSWDTAYTEKDYAGGSYSAMTAWGVFWSEETSKYCLLLLAAWWDRVGYPDLRRKAREEEKARAPDAQLIEKKASGQSLIQDLRRGRVRVRGYDPRPDGDKMGRAALASSSFEAGLIYAPETEWAQQVIDYVAQVPLGAPPSGDIGDTVTQAVRYLTKGWWIEHPDDKEDEATDTSGEYYDEDEDEQQQEEEGVYG